MKDILDIHKAKCPNFNKNAQVSIDGVSESKSSINSLNVYSIRFQGCRLVYPCQIIRPIGKYKLDYQKYLDNFLSDVCSNNCIIRVFVGDNPKRAEARASKTHSGYYACEYCEAKGELLNTQDKCLNNKKMELQKQKSLIVAQIAKAREEGCDEDEIESLAAVLKSIQEAIKTLNKKNNRIVWPASTSNAPERTAEKILNITDKIDSNENLSLDEAKGVLGRSLFLDIPYFNYVLDIPTEYLHNTCLGLVRKMIELTFNVGENRQRNTKRKLSLVASFNKLMSKIKVLHEFSRRARNLDFSVMKGQEYRNICIIFFPLVINCIDEGEEERRAWLLLAYMIRICILPNNEYGTIDPNVLKYCCEQFYELYEKLFHARNCTYNTHTVCSHLPKMRAHGPLTLTSAFGFEAFYGEMRQSFTPGTQSPLKQIIQKILMKRMLSYHCCKPSIYFSPKDTAMESNSYIYTFDQNEYQFYKIISIEGNTFECNSVGKYETVFPETPTLNWGKIGVFKAGEISNEVHFIDKNCVAGKLVTVLNLLITCPNNVLEEK